MKTFFTSRLAIVFLLLTSLMIGGALLPLTLAQGVDVRVAINRIGENNIDVDFIDIDVTTDNAIEILLAGAIEATRSKEVQAVNEQLYKELRATFVNQLGAEVLNQVKGLEVEIGNRLGDLRAISTDSDVEMGRINRQITALNVMRARLRADYNLTVEVVTENNGGDIPALYNTTGDRLIFLEWGNFNQVAPECAIKAFKNLGNDFIGSDGAIVGCENLNVSYEGNIQVDRGELRVLRKMFDENDELTMESDRNIAFTSNVDAFENGIWLNYKPEDGYGNPIVTVSMNSVSVEGRLNDVVKKSYALGSDHTLIIQSELRPFFIGGSYTSDFIAGLTGMGDEIDDLKRLRLRMVANSDDLNAAIIAEMVRGLRSYHFYGSRMATVASEIRATIDHLNGTENHDKVQKAINELRLDLNRLMDASRLEKYRKGLIPFRDTDDNMWFTPYVYKIKEMGVISGYEDKSGRMLGEFRPDNYISVAEGLKIALGTAGRGEAGIPNMKVAKDHWAAGYVAEAEDTEMTIVGTAINLDHAASRGDLVRMMLEALDFKVSSYDNIAFDDISVNDPNINYIDYAYDIGIVSGDDGTRHFRPNDPVNRAEVAKIAYLINNILLGIE